MNQPAQIGRHPGLTCECRHCGCTDDENGPHEWIRFTACRACWLAEQAARTEPLRDVVAALTAIIADDDADPADQVTAVAARNVIAERRPDLAARLP